MNQLGYGKGYKYAHDFKEKTTSMQCLPDNLVGRKYYIPGDEGFEKRVAQRLETLGRLKKAESDEERRGGSGSKS